MFQDFTHPAQHGGSCNAHLGPNPTAAPGEFEEAEQGLWATAGT